MKEENKFCKAIFKEDIKEAAEWIAIITAGIVLFVVAIGILLFVPATIGTLFVEDSWCNEYATGVNGVLDGCDNIDYWFVGVVPTIILGLIVFTLIKMYERWFVSPRVCKAFTENKLREDAERIKRQLEKKN